MLTHILPPGHQEQARRIQALLCRLLFSPPRIHFFSVREAMLLQAQPTWSGRAHLPQLQGRHEAQASASEPILTSWLQCLLWEWALDPRLSARVRLGTLVGLLLPGLFGRWCPELWAAISLCLEEACPEWSQRKAELRDGHRLDPATSPASPRQALTLDLSVM